MQRIVRKQRALERTLGTNTEFARLADKWAKKWADEWQQWRERDNIQRVCIGGQWREVWTDRHGVMREHLPA